MSPYRAAWHVNTATFDFIPFTRANPATSWRSSCVITLCHWSRGNVRGPLPILPYSFFYPTFPPVYILIPYLLSIPDCKGTYIPFLTPPASILFSPCQYVSLLVPVHIKHPLYHFNLLVTLNTPCWYIDQYIPLILSPVTSTHCKYYWPHWDRTMWPYSTLQWSAVQWLLIFWDEQDKLCLKAFMCFMECKFHRGGGHSINNKPNGNNLLSWLRDWISNGSRVFWVCSRQDW
jgi:hypothetical protein